MKKPQHGFAIEHWDWHYKQDVKAWLKENFGEGGTGWPKCDRRWGEQYDYGLENLYMDEDVYIWYNLRWGEDARI